jgi:hypothetical protein
MIGALVNASIPFFAGIYALLVGFRVVGKKPGQDPKYDQWHQKFGMVLKVCGPVLILLSIFFLVDGVARHR